MGLQRMRTVRQLAKEYKNRDPDTAINGYFLRRLIASGAITHIDSGKKQFINADSVDAYLAAGQQIKSENPEIGKIRTVRP